MRIQPASFAFTLLLGLLASVPYSALTRACRHWRRSRRGCRLYDECFSAQPGDGAACEDVGFASRTKTSPILAQCSYETIIVQFWSAEKIIVWLHHRLPREIICLRHGQTSVSLAWPPDGCRATPHTPNHTSEIVTMPPRGALPSANRRGNRAWSRTNPCSLWH